MSKTVLISLAAVVALIVIVVLLGMRYLRTEDEEDFEETSADHGRSSGRNGHQVRDHHARLRSHHEDHGDERPAGGSGRPGTARRTRGPDMRSAVRAPGQDRSWREDSGEVSRAGMPPQRDQHLVKSGRGGRRDYADMSEAAADRARQGAGRSRSQRGRTAGDGQGDRGYADLGGRRDDRDRTGGWDDRDFREARDARAGRENSSGRDTRDARRTSDGWDLSERREPSPAGGPREGADHNGDRRGATGPNARPDARRNGAKPDREALPPVRPRQGKNSQGRNKRDSEGDWPSTEWDELSDVDYWAELASDKPLTTATPAADASRSRRREPRPEVRQGQDARSAQNVRAAERQDVDAGAELPVKQIRHRERQPERAMVPGAPRAPHPIAAAPRSIPADDDPLTSPSFPTITTEDTRSYRRTRTARGDGRQPASHSGPMPAIGDDYTAPVGRQNAGFQQVSPSYPDLPAATAGYSRPAGQAGGYPPGAGYLPPAAATTPGHGDSGVRGAYLGPEPGGFLPEAGQVGQTHYQTSVAPGSGYQATGGYSFPPEPAGYDVRHTEHPGGYQGSEPAPGSLQGRQAGYPAEGYPSGSGPAANGSVPGGHADPAYPPAYAPTYPGAVPGGHTAPYQSPGTQLPGYPDYGPGSYDPANVAAQAPERPYADGDPYGADPYGFPGYGGTGY
jgi:hypothetical protein